MTGQAISLMALHNGLSIPSNAKYMLVTPDIAKQWLETQERNRGLSQAIVNKYARDMAAGQWVRTGEPIKFDQNCRLLDGQHRLQAVVAAGVPVWMDVLVGIPEDAQFHMDTGRKRTLADALSMHGLNYNRQLAATVRLVWLYDHGRPSRIVGSSSTIRTEEAIQYIETHPLIIDSCRFITNKNSLRKIMRRQSIASASHYIFARLSPLQANIFFDNLGDGVNLSKTDAIYMLRERLIRDRIGSTHLAELDMWALVIKAWNHYRQARPIRTLRWRTEGPDPESFPQAI